MKRLVKLQVYEYSADGSHSWWRTVATYATIGAAEAARDRRLARLAAQGMGTRLYRVTAPTSWLLDRNDVAGWDALRSYRIPARRTVPDAPAGGVR